MEDSNSDVGPATLGAAAIETVGPDSVIHWTEPKWLHIWIHIGCH